MHRRFHLETLIWAIAGVTAGAMVGVTAGTTARAGEAIPVQAMATLAGVTRAAGLILAGKNRAGVTVLAGAMVSVVRVSTSAMAMDSTGAIVLAHAGAMRLVGVRLHRGHTLLTM